MKLLSLFVFYMSIFANGMAQTIIYEDIPGASYNNIDGVIIDISPTVDISNCTSIEFIIDYSFSLPWEGSGGMESADECSTILVCQGDPEDPLHPDCISCWDFMWIQFMVDGDPVAENLIGEDGTDDSEQSGTFSFIQCVNDETEANIEIHNMNWTTAEINTFENVMIICWEKPTITTNDPICGAQNLTLDGDVPGSDPVSSWEWTTDGPAVIDDENAQNTFASGPEDGDEFTLTITDINGCEGSETVAVVVGGFDAEIDGGGTICGCTDVDSDLFIDIMGGSPLYTAVIQVNGITIPGLPAIDVNETFRICNDPDIIFPGYDDSQSPIEIAIPSFLFPIDIDVISITDDVGCMANIIGGTISYSIADLPEINEPVVPDFCVGSDGLIDLTVMDDQISGGSGNDVLWFEDEDLEDQINNPGQYNVNNGNTVWAVVDDGDCFSEPVEVGLNFNIQPEFTIIQNAIEDCGSNPYFLPSVFDIVDIENAISPAYYLDEDHTIGPINSINPDNVNEIFIYDGSTPGCDVIVSIPVSVTPFPIIESPLNQLGGCGEIELPDAEGDYIDSYEYNTEEDGSGTSFLPGDIISASSGITTIYLIALSEEGCRVAEELDLLLVGTVNYFVNIMLPICDSLILPPITPNTGAVAYYSATQGMGTQFSPGDIIFAPFSGNIFIFDPTIDQTCASEDTLMLDISFGPQPMFPSDTTACGFLVLPGFGNSTGPNIRYSTLKSNTNTSVILPGDTIRFSQQLYILDTLGSCTFLDSMSITINSPAYTGIDTSITVCEGFVSSNFNFMELLQNPNLGGNWSYPVVPDFNPIDSTDINLSVFPAGNWTFVYGIENEGCGLQTSQINIEIVQPQYGGENAVVNTCIGIQSLNFMALINNPDLGGMWEQVSGMELIDLSDTTNVDISSVGTGNYAFLYVIEGEATSEFCEAESSSLFLTINPGPNAGADNDLTVCIGETIDLNTLLSPNADLNGMYEGSGIFFAGSSWNTSTGNPGQTYDINYIIESGNANCPNDTAFLAITLVDLLTAGMPVNDLNICQASDIQLSDYLIGQSNGGIFVLTSDFTTEIPNGEVTVGTESSFAYITNGIGGCPADTTELNFTINPQPNVSVNSLNPIVVCGGDSDLAALLEIRNSNGLNIEYEIQIIEDASGGVVLDATYNNASDFFLNIIGSGSNFELSNDTIYLINNPGSYTYSINANSLAFGCPAALPLTGQIEIFESYTETIDLTLCPNESFDFRGQLYSQSTTVEISNIQQGCDSIFIINIDNHVQENGIVSGVFCTGDQVNVLGNIYAVNTSIVETFVGMAAFGCDSIVDINISFQDQAPGFVLATLCSGQDTIIENQLFNEAAPSGSILLLNGSTAGCDSLINVDITFTSSVVFDLNQTLCMDEIVNVGSDEYSFSNPNGSTLLTGAAMGGCDSIVNVALDFYSDPTFNITNSICADETIQVGSDIYGANNLTGQTIFPSASVNGCDSTVNVSLSLLPNAMSMLIATLCPGESINVGNDFYDEQNFSGTSILTNQASNGCDSIVNVLLSFDAPQANFIVPIICHDQTSGVLTIVAIEALNFPITITINNNSSDVINSLPFTTIVEIGNNSVSLTDNSNCSYEEIINVQQAPQGMAEINVTSIGINQFSLEVIADFTVNNYIWNSAAALSCVTCSNPNATISQTTDVSVELTSVSGCITTQNITLEYTEPPLQADFYLANTIDVTNPPNDVFYVQTNDDTAIIDELLIFDRWGNKVFERVNTPANDPQSGWNGRMNSRYVNQGVYVYTLKITTATGTQVLVGDITVLR